MRRFAAVALVVGLCFPLSAQHGGSHGGFSSHGASASHGSFHASTPSHFSSAPRPSLSRPTIQPHGYSGPAELHGAARAPYTGSWRYRRPYVSPHRSGVRYGVGGWISPGYLGFPSYIDDSGDQDQASVQDSDQGYDVPPPPDQFAYPNQSGPQLAEAPATAQDAVTLVFADGRPPEQIHNYMLTRTTLFVLDQRHRDIPLNELDLAATAKVNRDAGIDFRLPELPGQ